MDEFMKMLAKAMEEGNVKVVHVGKEAPKAEEPVDVYAEAKKEAQEIAALNRILVDAHIAAGFDEMDALELTCAVIGSNNN